MGGGQSQNEKNNQANNKEQQNRANAVEDTSADTLKQYAGPVTASPYYKSMLTAGTQSTNNAYDAANRNMKLAMSSAGVGGRSGAAVGNTAAIGASRAGALGQVPLTAMEQATQQQDAAMALNNQLASTESGAAGKYADLTTQERMQREQEQAGLLGAMLGASTGLGSTAMKVWGA